MKKLPILFLLFSSLAYSRFYVSLKQDFSGVSNATLMFFTSGTIFFLSIIMKLGQLANGTPLFAFESRKQILNIFLLGIYLYVGDFFNFEASHYKEVTLIMQTSVFVMIPVIASAMQYGSDLKLPNLGQIGACALILTGVVMYMLFEKS